MPLMQEKVGFVERLPWLMLERVLLQLMLLHGKPDHVAASAASRAAGHAAATAHVKDHAVHAATYAVKAIFYDTLMEEQERRVLEERTWQYQYLLGGCNDHGERTR
ncbi:hypothetical protein BK131_10225 [Paenibacillus amylolyticus]|uniref:Imm-5-like domain-containing protein n=1 Tax=Paenibacillus amylolyticus TaxID=1451 RepID=A0A1R1BZL1_PAEAM|nr:hypothetical protein BK131_10225 [Paenibacillus amylolyticus]